MAIKPISSFSFAFSMLLTVASIGYGQEIPFRLISGNRVVISGTVAGGKELSMLVDTGADCTVIDTRAAQRMQLRTLPQTVKYSALSKTEKARLAVVEDLQAGPISTSLACIVDKIPTDGVDMILGLNVLSKHNFEIDYEHRKIVFDPSDAPAATVPFETDSTLIVVKAQVRGKMIRALVDTGAAAHCVFEESWILQTLDYTGVVAIIPHMGGRSRSAEVALSSFVIGSTEWKDLDAMALSNGKPLSWDVVLSVGKLGLKRIYFDFRHRSLSWIKGDTQ